MKQQKQFVLVHGGCHGAWCWYKVKPSLEAAGHRVVTVDLAASGVDKSQVEDIQTLHDYARPLLELVGKLGPDERVILVAHSLGGTCAALAADTYPSKVSVVVFLASFVPDVTNPPTYVMEKLLNTVPPEAWMDTKYESYGTPDRPLRSILLGPKFLAKKMYQHTPIQDLELAKMLVRPTPLISSIMTGTMRFSKDGYGSVSRVCIVCGEDTAIISKEGQRWMNENFPVEEVMEIRDADHMPMLSKPDELCDHLLKIADKYA